MTSKRRSAHSPLLSKSSTAPRSSASPDSAPGSTGSSQNRKIKTKIVKTYHHNVCMTYGSLMSTEDLQYLEDDSDPEETHKVMSTLVLNTDRCPSTTSRSHSGHRTKHSIGGISTIDSGVVSHDSLLDHIHRETMSTNRSESGGSSSGSPHFVRRGSANTSSNHNSSPLSTRRQYSPLGQRRSASQNRGEFDPLNRTVLLDSQIRSRSRGRLEQIRGKSPCRGQSVKHMINFFETGSQEDINGSSDPITSTPNITKQPHTSLRQTSSAPPKDPVIKPALYQHTSPQDISPYRLARSRASKSKQGSPTTAIAADSDAIATTPTSRSKQDNNLHLTCVASGYAKYSPYSERKKYSDDGSGATPPLTPNSQNGSTHKLNGAVAKDTNGTGGAEEQSQSIDNGVAETHDNGDVGQTLAEDSNGIINTSLANRNSSNNGRLSANDREIASSEDIDLKIEIEMTRDTTPNINEGKTPEIPADSDSHINGVTTNGDTKDEVDRAALKLDLSLPDSQHKKKEVKIQTPEKLNGVIQNGVQDSPSKKNGEWFLKITDEAQSKLLAYCDIAQKDLDENDLTEEVSGQIRAAIGKAHLLVNKKFKQFRGLCDKNLTQAADEPRPTTSQDLAGFWDMVNIQVENIADDFSDIDVLRENNWVPKPKVDTEDVTIKPTTPRSATTPRGNKSFPDTPNAKPAKAKPANKPTSGAKASRDEARKRIMAAKKAMRQRKRSESDDVIFVS